MNIEEISEFIKMKISVNTKSEIIRVNHPFDVILIDSRMISIPFYFNVYEQVNPYNLARWDNSQSFIEFLNTLYVLSMILVKIQMDNLW